MPASRIEILSRNLHLGDYAHHVLLCVGGDCAPREEQERSWQFLKRRIQELGRMDVAAAIYRSKVECLRVCVDGPIALVYPDAVWYRRGTPENLERILQEHVIGGQPVQELAFARNPLFRASQPGPGPSSRDAG